MYLPNPLCSIEEKETMASNIGASLDTTKFEKSKGEIDETFGCVDTYGSYSRVVT